MTHFKSYISLFLVVFLSTFSNSQNSDGVLFTLAGEPIKVSEFVRVYEKNLDLVKDESQKDIDTYFDLFVNYKLKIKEAKALGYEEKPQYIREFNNYKNQLSKNYLTDHNVTEALVKEAYERMNYDVNVSHILVTFDQTSKDTSLVYNQMLTFKERFENEDFEDIKGTIQNGGNVIAEDLGYFSAFKMVYPFETMAYNTKVGEVSKPFRTRFGYHVLKVHDKRPSRGEVTVGHIMIAHNSNDSLTSPENKINEVYRLLQQGQEFENLAKQFSEDKSSSKKGGRLNSFKSGQLSSVAFEDKAFSLKAVGEITEPFETEFGYHIVKLYEKKAIGTFEDLKPSLEQRVKRDGRSRVITESFVDSLKIKYNVKNANLSYFESIVDDTYFSHTWSKPESVPSKTLVAIQDMAIQYDEFVDFLEVGQKRIREKQSIENVTEVQYNAFLQDRILKYHEANLENDNADYAFVLSEYRDGLLLFDLMQDKVWNAVQKDSVALQNHYNKNASNYKWPERIDAIIATSSNADYALQAKQGFEAGKDIESLKSEINNQDQQNIVFTSGKFEKDFYALPPDFNFEQGVSKVYNYNDAYSVILVNQVLDAAQKTFEEAKGNVISEYQQVFEEQWLQSLKNKYEVEINQDVFEQVKTQINK